MSIMKGMYNLFTYSAKDLRAEEDGIKNNLRNHELLTRLSDSSEVPADSLPVVFDQRAEIAEFLKKKTVIGTSAKLYWSKMATNARQIANYLRR